MREAVGAHPHLMVLGIVAGLVWAVARVSVPLLAGAAIDHGIAEGRTGLTPGDRTILSPRFRKLAQDAGAVAALSRDLLSELESL